MADEENPQLPTGLRPDRGGGFLAPAAKPDFAPTNPAPAGGEPGAFTGEVATLGGFEVQGAGAERFAPKYPEVSSGYGPTVESASQAGVESVEPPVEYGDTRPARSSRMSSYDTASAERQARAGGAATFAQESAAREARDISDRREVGAPDSRDRDRTGAMSFNDARKLVPTERNGRGRVTGQITNRDAQRDMMNSTRFDNPKNQSVLAKLQRGLGGEKVTQSQLDQAYGSGRISLSGQSREAEPVAAAPTIDDDVTSAIDDDATSDFDQGSLFNTGGASNGSYGFNTLNNS